jgi:membrane protein
MSFKDAWCITKRTFSDFVDSNVLKLSGALAFFTIFSLPGLLIIVIWFSDIFYGRDVVEGAVYKQVEGFVGHDAAISIQDAIRNSTADAGSQFATIIGLVALIVGATSVFGEIQDSINRIWRLKAKPRKGLGIFKFIFNRLLSFSMIIALGFILLVSLVINGGMDILLNNLMEEYPQVTVVLVYILNIVLTFLITYYLGHSRMTTTTYGAAGSVIVILLWVYYSSMILYFGACFTHVWVVYKGSKIYPNSYAVWVQQIEVESDKSVQQQPEKKAVIEAPPPRAKEA